MENKKDILSDNRRDFLKKSALAGMAAVLTPVTSLVANNSLSEEANDVICQSGKNKSQKVTFLITTDIHSQLNTHDEFFWENNTAVYKKRGGMAVLKTMIESFRKQNPANTILYDGGDFFHGHAVASLTEGEALIPIFNNLNYDLMLPGNWEVVYKKKKMLYDLGHVNAAKICANMWHKTTDADNGELVYPPYWIKYIGGIPII
jgi:2',3'-cyclic-nucleotide 2'-phosphodiesterase (5'-nucleotidase family)